MALTAAERKELEQLREENAKLKKRADREVTFKVGKAGGLSMYGLGRFPVTLYKEQWNKLLAHADQIKQALSEHDKELKEKE